MRVSELAGFLTSEGSPFSTHLLEIKEKKAFYSLPPESRALFVAASYQQQPRKILVVCGTHERALVWQSRLTLSGVPAGEIFHLPSGTSNLFEDGSPEFGTVSDRLGAFRALCEEGPKIIIASSKSALERTLPKDTFSEAFVLLKSGVERDPIELSQTLKKLGYHEMDPVAIPGSFSRRGGIIDVWPSGVSSPARVEWFDTEIESIRTFDPTTQRSTGSIPALFLAPSREILFTDHDQDHIVFINQQIEREAAGLESEAAEKLSENISRDMREFGEGTFFDRIELYRPTLYPDSGGVLDFLESGADQLILEEPLELEAIANRAEEELTQALESRSKRGEILHSHANDFVQPIEHLGSFDQTWIFSAMNEIPKWLDHHEIVDLGGASLENYRGRPDALSETLISWKKAGVNVCFSTDQPKRAQAVLSNLEFHPLEEVEGMIIVADSRRDLLFHGNLGGGFIFPLAKLAVVTDAELFGVARLRLPQKRFAEGAPIATVLDLKPGDFVVHINFGIGRFKGLVNRVTDGTEREFLYVEYQAPDKLFVPADQLDRIQKYLNPVEAEPKLNRLTGGEWQRTLGKAKEEAQAFARDLVKLYAKRKEVQRLPYGPDTPFQTEMEQTFPWVETPSQLKAIKEAKNDMEQPFPMDRLICGDVGFGKTEVAIRAAFKAVQSGRQVAVLCPTTILSEQHYRNFIERLESFGTKVGLINRFTHASNRKQIVNDLKSGAIEIVLGTHALLGTGIEFKHLGLVIIDEEQKFGVKQKEMLKKLREEVDVLTLSATPIPRTLSMALMDIRQMSLINDPPPGRLPVRTTVRPYAPEVVRESILREMSRGGQVFYVYNRVQSIHHVAEKLRKLVPTARIGIGHGQMTEAELEPIMIGFIKGEIDILLSTTIIESGLDIPNANTLIIENSDRLGLAQLYQLRGRVGRSDRQAYAMFLYDRPLLESTLAAEIGSEFDRPSDPIEYGKKKKKTTIGENAFARLKALQEFSSLGSGYSLAFRDLQIRGAGEMLGAKQSGTMVQVGYELYTQLINEAVASLKHSVDGDSEALDDVRDPLAAIAPLPSYDIPVVALLPNTYIKEAGQRLYFYQQMMSSRTALALDEVQGEVVDRFGKLPVPAQLAFSIMHLRLRGKEIGIEKLDAKQGRLSINFRNFHNVPPRLFTIISGKYRSVYKSQETLIWPFEGNPISAIDNMTKAIEVALEQIDASRAHLPS